MDCIHLQSGCESAVQMESYIFVPFSGIISLKVAEDQQLHNVPFVSVLVRLLIFTPSHSLMSCLVQDSI